MIPLFDTPAPRRIVIFRALQLGDMLCCVPALRALRAACPHAHIALVGLPWARDFVARYPTLLDEFIAFPGAHGFPEQAEDESGLPAFLHAMRLRRFDLAIQLHGSGGVANALVHAFGACALVGFSQPGETPPPGRFLAWPDRLPEPQRYLALLHAAGVRGRALRDDTLWFPLHDADRAACAALIDHHGLDPWRLVLVHPGAQLPSRRWPAERFAALADALALDGWQIAVTGTAHERELTAGMLGAMTQGARHLTGETTLGALAALVRAARLVVCNDTGLSHLAAAMRTPSVVVACGSDTRRWAPLDRARHRVIADWPECRPCMYPVCPHGHPCALNVSVEEVATLARTQLQGADGPPTTRPPMYPDAPHDQRSLPPC
ncbi:ADP-heptose:LPS heptosyltransferase [Paraburkholderia eburnea]|uniref:ADP-heptose:LPS heptosyltransferase n=1 Tax=Paraburkholderia eburnea TaxID=1189126 RepID=A0A2S4LTL4_9BURK|nr:glycosyltransferase family 9 protein [Paraburkholderia eburnea]POR45803.1 ADP-heptose:LPS heptosyltransferase [Paraburkholderia eburnea]PRZ14660.1 ADP-heptose:LPS heptosyltransferase [Paraburkholderia eburnea]